MHILAVFVKEGLPFARDSSLQNSADSYLCLQLALLHSMSYFFFLYRSPFSALCTGFDSISSNIDEVLSINPSAVFVFGDFNPLRTTRFLPVQKLSFFPNISTFGIQNNLSLSPCQFDL